MPIGLKHSRLITLGRLTLVGADGVEDRELATRKRKLALLAFLALSRHAVTRDALTELFWAEQPEERARHSLSDALSHLRRVLGPDAITQRRSEVSLAEHAPLAVDVLELRAAAKAQGAREVIALYGGPFFDAVHVGGSARFEQWVDDERSACESSFRKAAQLESNAAFMAKRFDDCALLSRKWLDFDPLSAEAAALRLRGLCGDESANRDQRALDEYARIVRLLLVEFGSAPDRSVATLAGEIETRALARRASLPALGTAAVTDEAVPVPMTVREPAPVSGPERAVTVDTITVATVAHVEAPLGAATTNVRRVSTLERSLPTSWRRVALLTGAATAVIAVALLLPSRAPARPATEDPAVIAMSSVSAEATALYQRAVAGYDRDANRQLAVALLDSAVLLDSTFAMAYRRLATIYGRGVDDQHRMLFMLRKAAQYAERLPAQERALTMGAYHTSVTHDYARAAGFYRELLAIAPSDARAWSSLGVVYDYLGDRRRSAEAYARSLALNPKRMAPWMNLADARYDLGDAAGAARALDSLALYFPAHASVFMRTAAFAHSEGDSVQAESQLRALITASPGDAYLQSAGYMLLARALWSYGRVAEGAAARLAGIEADRARGSREGMLAGYLDLAQADLWLGHDPVRARRRVRAALRVVPLDSLDAVDRPYLDLIAVLALCGSVADARALFAEYERTLTADERRGRMAAERRALGVLLIAENRVAEGLATLVKATDPVCAPCGLPELSWAYERGGFADSAAAVHRRYDAMRSSRKLDATDAFHRARIARQLRDAATDN